MDFVTTDSVRLHYETRGDGLPLYVCHGGPSTTYDYLVKDLEPLESDCRIVYHDYRGSGRSEKASPDTYRFDRLGDDLNELRLHLGDRSIAVLAHSMGGLVALNFAIRQPEACNKLVLLSVTPGGSVRDLALPVLRALGAYRLMKMVGRALVYATFWRWRPDSPQKTRAQFSIMGTMQEPKRAMREAVRARETLSQNDNASHLERLGFATDLRPELRRIMCPALVIFGTRDALFAASAPLLQRGIAEAQLLPLEGVGHHPLVEAPGIVLPAVARFVRDTGDGAGRTTRGST
jgi:proline iminopeptidase